MDRPLCLPCRADWTISTAPAMPLRAIPPIRHITTAITTWLWLAAGVYELIDGAWVRLDLASEWGFDGYTVQYAADNTFTYSFNINMNEAKPRTFRVVVE